MKKIVYQVNRFEVLNRFLSFSLWLTWPIHCNFAILVSFELQLKLRLYLPTLYSFLTFFYLSRRHRSIRLYFWRALCLNLNSLFLSGFSDMLWTLGRRLVWKAFIELDHTKYIFFCILFFYVMLVLFHQFVSQKVCHDLSL